MSKPSWRCFFCDAVFTDGDAARDHFGATGEERPACQLKASEGGLLGALRGAEAAAMEAWDAVHAESADALKAWRAAESRHRMAERAAEETGYQRGVDDCRTEAVGLRTELIHALEELVDHNGDDMIDTRSNRIAALRRDNGE